MAHTQKVRKIFVNPNGAAVIRCPKCESVKKFQADKYRGAKHNLKVKCSCEHHFLISLEFRKFYRKPTSLAGSYKVLPEKIVRGRMMVVNISKGGLGLKALGSHRLQPGQELQVSFVLDDKQGSLIERKVMVRLVNHNYIGCEFLGEMSHDKTLGFYLMA